MPEEKFTRCPGCRTVFRVTDQQLSLREGKVRCGHCRTVFDGVAELVSLAPRPEDDDFDYDDEAMRGPPTVTLRRAHALQPAPLPTPADRGTLPPAGDVAVDGTVTAGPHAFSHEVAPAPAAAPGAGAAPPAEPAPGAAPHGAHDHRLAGSGERPAAGTARGEAAPARVAPLAWALGVGVLAILLAGQLVFHFRESLAARWPAAARPLTAACAALGCTVGAPLDIADLSIDASDLQADPAHQGLLVLGATLRNRGSIARAYPYLELTLTDARDQVVVRRALAPAEYAGGTVDLTRGIPANGEVLVKVFIDASATSQAGYRLYLFYG